MNTKCIKKISINIFSNEIKFKLSISALMLINDNKTKTQLFDLENENLEIKSNNNLKNNKNDEYILRILMTSFEPIELTTKLGGPWEGYFLWNTIQDRVNFKEKKLSIIEFIDIIDIYFNKIDELEILNSKSNIEDHESSLKIMNYCEYLKQDSTSNNDIIEESEKIKDYFLNIKLEGMDSDIFLHLRSSIRNNVLVLNDTNIIKCLSEMLDLIKIENNYLHNNLKNLIELNKEHHSSCINNNLCKCTNNEFIQSDLLLKSQQKYIKTENFDINDSLILNNNNSPNTRGTLKLSELKVNDEINYNEKNSDLDFSSITKETNSNHLLKEEYKNKILKDNYFNKNDNYNSKKNYIKTYHFIKDLSSNYSKNQYDVFNHESFLDQKSSNLKSTIETIRKAQSELFADNDSEKYEIKINQKKFLNDKNYQYESKNLQIYKNNEKPPLLTKEQLMNKLSKTKDIGERIDILKNIIRTTKKESISFQY